MDNSNNQALNRNSVILWGKRICVCILIVFDSFNCLTVVYVIIV